MKFPYSSIISSSPDGDEFFLFRRPEIPIPVVGPAGSAAYVGLVDTGSDNTILPKSVADYLGITIQPMPGPAANVFGGQRVQLLAGETILKLEADGEILAWRAAVCFFEFTSETEESVILGHSGFLDYLTATFDGQLATLTLTPNDELPRVD